MYEQEADVYICIRCHFRHRLFFFNHPTFQLQFHSFPFYLFAHELQECSSIFCIFLFVLSVSALFICQHFVLSIFLHHHCPIIYYYDTNVYKTLYFHLSRPFYLYHFLFSQWLSRSYFISSICETYFVRSFIIYHFTLSHSSTIAVVKAESHMTAEQCSDVNGVPLSHTVDRRLTEHIL